MNYCKYSRTRFVALLFIAGIYLGMSLPLYAETITFGTSWALPDEVSYNVNPTPNGVTNGGPPPLGTPPVPDAEGSETVRVAQFRPEWGTLEGVILEVDGSALYTALLIGPTLEPLVLGGAAGYSADVSFSGPGYSDSGSDTASLVDGSDFLSILFGFDGVTVKSCGWGHDQAA